MFQVRPGAGKEEDVSLTRPAKGCVRMSMTDSLFYGVCLPELEAFTLQDLQAHRSNTLVGAGPCGCDALLGLDPFLSSGFDLHCC